jgi:hypothetical protein
MTNAVRHHCSWSSCSRLYVKTWGGQSYCGDKDCPATKVVPQHGPRYACPVFHFDGCSDESCGCGCHPEPA